MISSDFMDLNEEIVNRFLCNFFYIFVVVVFCCFFCCFFLTWVLTLKFYSDHFLVYARYHLHLITFLMIPNTKNLVKLFIQKKCYIGVFDKSRYSSVNIRNIAVNPLNSISGVYSSNFAIKIMSLRLTITELFAFECNHEVKT